MEELLKLYVNLFYRFCANLLFPEIFEQKKSQISELSAILDFGGYACDIISRVTQEFFFNFFIYFAIILIHSLAGKPQQLLPITAAPIVIQKQFTRYTKHTQ